MTIMVLAEGCFDAGFTHRQRHVTYMRKARKDHASDKRDAG
jgi:hypothetical protein